MSRVQRTHERPWKGGNDRKSKPAIKSVGMVGNGVGLITNAAALLAVLGVGVSGPVAIGITAGVGLVSNLLGLFGRKRAQERIDGVFFPRPPEPEPYYHDEVF